MNTTSQSSASSTAIIQWFLVLILYVAAVTTSVLTVYSCNFFTYRKRDDDALNDNSAYAASTAELTYEPFEYLPEAGVGLFSYYMGGDAYGKSVMVNDRNCFYYCDEEYTDYQWLSSNTKGSGSGNIDVWLLARYCSILAPIFGTVAFLQSVVEITGCCCCRSNRIILSQRWQSCGRIWKSLFLSMAILFQLGTFLILYAPPVMYSTSSDDQRQQFCFSSTSNVHCRMDAGSAYSLASVLLYLFLAALSFFCVLPPAAAAAPCACNSNMCKREKPNTSEEETDDSSNSNDERLEGGIEH